MEKKLLFLLFMVSLFMCTQAEATVLTYNGWAGDNNNIADKYDDAGENYGSRISSSPVTYHETGASDISAVFTVGNGWTPNIELTWGGGRWDTYTGWRGHEVAQVQGSSPGDPLDLVFTPDAGYGVLINSFDLDEWAGGGGCVVDWKVSDATGTLASGTWTGNTAGYRSTVNTGLTIADMTIDNVVTLSFEQTAGDDTYLAMDDTNFDQFGGTNATNPSPANKATDVPRDVVLSWTPGVFAAPTNGHKAYFGESFDDVNDATGAVAQSAASYTLAQRLDFDKTYYWRVDEVNAPPTSHVEFKGNVWIFTTEPIGYAIENITATASSALSTMGPENTVNGSGMDADDLHSIEQTDMWVSGSEPEGAWIEFEFDRVYKLHEMLVWNSNQMIEYIVGFGVKGVTIEYSADGTSYATLGTTHEFAQAPGTPGYAHNTTIDFGGAAAKKVRLTITSNWGFLPQYSLSEVRFFYIPVLAREPQPDSGAIDTDVDVTLSWRAGREAAEHNVYIDTDEQAVIDSNVPVITVTEASHGPISLDLGETYYWKVNEVNDAETPTIWEGDVWNFRTQEYFVVEDFEDYNDYPGYRIYETWADGYEIPTNGAMIGYPEPLNFAAGEHILETTDVHSGEQSLPFFYDNSTVASSEASVNIADLPIGSDWTGNGVKSLSLWFYGDVNNAPEQMYVKLNGVKVLYESDASNLSKAAWQPFNINLTDFTGVDLSNITELSIGFERIGFSGGTGMVLFDDIRLYRPVTSDVPLITITVPDAGFDDHVLNNVGDYVYVGDAAYTGPWKSAGGDAWIDYGYYVADVDLPALSGNNKLYGYDDVEDYIYQILDETFIEGATYTLSVWVGIAWSGYADDWSLYFTGEDYNNNLIEASGDAPVGSWQQVSLVYTATAADAGNKIGIKMKGAIYVTFEDVTLFYSSDE